MSYVLLKVIFFFFFFLVFLNFILYLFIFIGVQLLNNVVLVSAVQQSEPVTCIFIFTPFLDFLPIQVTTEHCVEFPVLDSWFSLVIYFICSINNVYVSVPISQLLPSHLFSLWYPQVCSLCLCLYFCFVNKILYTSFFRFYIRALIYNICRLVDVQYIYFSLLAFASMFLFENISRCKRMNLPLSLLQNIVYFSSLMYFDLSSLPAQLNP